MRTFSCDIETDGIEATKVWCIAVHNIDTDQCITFAGPCLNLFKPWMESEADCLIFHNGISFDVPVLERLLDVDFSNIQIEDTLVMSQLRLFRRLHWQVDLQFHCNDHLHGL